MVATRAESSASLSVPRASHGGSPASGSQRHLRIRTGIVVLIALYILVWGASGLLNITVTDFDAFFWPSARIAAAGHPFEIYRVRYNVIYPNANGPLAIVPLSLVAELAGRLGWLDDPALRRMLAMSVFSVFSLLLSHEAVLACDRLLARPLRRWRRLLAYALFALCPELWHGVLLYGHLEQPLMLWLTLLSVRMLVTRRGAWAGVLLGLALLARSTTLLYLLPLVLLTAYHRRWSILVRLVSACAVVVTAGLTPFWLVDRTDVVYSLLTFRGLLPIGGGTFWRLAVGTSWQAFADQHDSLAILAAALLLCCGVLALRRELDVGSRDLYALLALSGLCFPLLIKTLWPYYFLDAYVLLALWWLASPRPQPAFSARARWAAGLLLPLGVIGLAQVAEAGVTVAESNVWDVPWSVTVGVGVVALIAVVLLWLWRLDPRASGENLATVASGPALADGAN